MWPTVDDQVTCTCSGGENWDWLNENLNDTSLTIDCEVLCLAQNSAGCCEINVGTWYPGCWWMPNGKAYCSGSPFESLSFACTKKCKVL